MTVEKLLHRQRTSQNSCACLRMPSQCDGAPLRLPSVAGIVQGTEAKRCLSTRFSLRYLSIFVLNPSKTIAPRTTNATLKTLPRGAHMHRELTSLTLPKRLYASLLQADFMPWFWQRSLRRRRVAAVPATPTVGAFPGFAAPTPEPELQPFFAWRGATRTPLGRQPCAWLLTATHRPCPRRCPGFGHKVWAECRGKVFIYSGEKNNFWGW